MTDVRWSQRFNHFKKAYSQLQEALDLMAARELSNIEKQGAIQAFEFTYELAWNVLRDFLVWQGIETISGSRDAIREGFKRELISDGHTWLAMLQDRNRTVHTYNEETAKEILNHLQHKYSVLFAEFFKTFSEKQNQLDEEF
ncbi:nucleotidyltransferase substrate binding protein [Oceanospirillum linum]|uniref:Nucleotidyltransferase n=1 Tax=Oceanospirillum linum TaxID=966 RepID=A0A1T1HBE2_OCELI|nr:nucleotidyltransferase substrate binding protein [Oceanospirillum linum]OOV87047.1 nucleotidyltransferase [Oceanospirillum linum]SEF72754.1 nucleotidyltransferase substrate binding protein, HI0074 family [Oleiphilus messinensis]SMP16089.1 nucleotidyltransferase substrate binding protein, HI0074 family [Oceanospirillum linum]